MGYNSSESMSQHIIYYSLAVRKLAAETQTGSGPYALKALPIYDETAACSESCLYQSAGFSALCTLAASGDVF